MKTLNRLPFYSVVIFAFLMLLLRGMSSCEVQPTPTREEIYEACKGKIGDKCDQDTVYYEQHPKLKGCCKIHWK